MYRTRRSQFQSKSFWLVIHSQGRPASLTASCQTNTLPNIRQPSVSTISINTSKSKTTIFISMFGTSAARLTSSTSGMSSTKRVLWFWSSWTCRPRSVWIRVTHGWRKFVKMVAVVLWCWSVPRAMLRNYRLIWVSMPRTEDARISRYRLRRSLKASSRWSTK